MAAPVRLLVRRVFGRTSSAISVSTPGRLHLSAHCWASLSGRCFSDEAGEKNTHFGFETVPEAEKAKKVYKVFENVAQKYDLMNDAMSLGIHRLWKDALLHAMHPHPGAHLLDVAGGTGDIAFRFLKYVASQKERRARRLARSMQTPSWQDISDKYSGTEEEEGEKGGLRESRAVVCDINKEMLKVGREKAHLMGISAGVSWVVGDAEELPFNDDQFDIYTIAFGIRNVTHVDLALEEALRVLKPGGRFMCLEFSKVTNPVLARLYDAYSFQVIPVLGEVIAGDWKSYQYLVESIRKFPAQEEFKEMIEDAGFSCVHYHNLTGGVVSLHSGFKM
ncbi:2-methoxy-6-polyprenyl-1,4-benzoquinol methylase, mitochondrial [Syngnathoides biaculeatus]|uniref:2-methoxy-6-polyprenyl-1,4-benzoquinol methylase, mitochondrial n=1 Tax=Syngnathoides biaculeatus TaxID=300417 RepID=UPI002ADE6BBC|nr:2-methoxy-6-polyprenyl-1,4-benzoquinol methylase, mitochondrial [Syngnathoides biaculeatus]XP_061672868.1 2-methoxy-6-polyprenyl-1,4-benzoquinol methylase, mitochondrial [Syngnathoides biaculeatus]XP_061672869.1 2-methoxy-6-polyprenyl-1,4-benzoquinol methylase, mitochondrial [Syngnathoides biaculeatus]